LLVNRSGEVRVPGYESKSPGDPPPPVYVTPGVTIPSPAKEVVGLTVRGAANQEKELQRWEDSTANLLFAILRDGNISSAKIDLNPLTGSATKRLPICDKDGNQVGWIPIHPLS
jgi:hypothetical protein